ncbi:hypothetical protein [Bradyrhizobium sp.]|uniref:hypothetical protein n=1 Tax=Bradyrhizobium sp. TaxID=376 RepID=UPI001DB2ECE5|nr:hypothetical protein [Bradyrhizobium sp.]MBV8700261.1 hypothetical protein [Bradyrhizobium sp.]MBV8923651.1 hypothetical protein [Bradyrhizobium sp.]MBV9978817.1 hypothetical protein [Bradyrhizobium sp.]
MKPIAMVLVALACGAALSRADAAPPTVTPSPGYDARLKEERAARSAQPRYEGLPQAAVRLHSQRIRHHRHTR